MPDGPPNGPLNPFRRALRDKRDKRDKARAQIREKVEPVPDVICTFCHHDEPMEYLREYSSPSVGAPSPVIEAMWDCRNCDGTAFGYVTPDGLTSVLDNARAADENPNTD